MITSAWGDGMWGLVMQYVSWTCCGICLSWRVLVGIVTFALPTLRHRLPKMLGCLLTLNEGFYRHLAFLYTPKGGFLLCGFCTMDWQLWTGKLFQLDRTSDFFPANEFTAFHTTWIRVPFLLSWIFKESFLPELHAEITAFVPFSHVIFSCVWYMF